MIRLYIDVSRVPLDDSIEQVKRIVPGLSMSVYRLGGFKASALVVIIGEVPPRKRLLIESLGVLARPIETII